MHARFHIVGCAVAAQPDQEAIDEFVEWARRFGALVLSQDDGKAVFVQYDAAGAQLILHGCRTAASRRQPPLRFGFASGVKEANGPGGAPRVGSRGLQQACDLAAAARPGQVLVSSQLGSLLQLAELEPCERLLSRRLVLPDGRPASAFLVEPPRARSSADRPPA
jgi:class 3 adenylate cyclase